MYTGHINSHIQYLFAPVLQDKTKNSISCVYCMEKVELAYKIFLLTLYLQF